MSASKNPGTAPENPAQITQQTIDGWKQKYGDVFKYATEDGVVAYFRKPTRSVLSLATSAATTDPMKFNEIIIENCFLGGDERVKTEDKYFLGLSGEIATLIEKVEGELKKV